jgi:5-methylthioadenosine/S-adenosylhomocysteine deaminase
VAKVNTLIRNGYVVTMDAERRILDPGGALIGDDRIIWVGAGEPPVPYDEAVDAANRIVLPGLVNTHVHTSQQLGRGLGDDVSLLTWLHERIWPYESNMTEEDSYTSTLLCGIEQIRSGVTTFAEPGGQHVPGMCRAVRELGLRAILARSTMDGGEGLPAPMVETTDETLAIQEQNLRDWHDRAQGRIKIWFALRTIFNNSDELITRSKELADKHKVGLQMHVAEVKEEVEFAAASRGHTTVEHLAHLGVLGSNFLAVHTVWLTDHEVELFAEHDVKVSHNPAAAMRVLGFALIPEMIDAGICVTIGTDGAPSNNRMSLIDEMYVTALIHKGRTLDPTVMPAQKIVEMVTVDGARGLLWDKEIGSLEVGKKADLVIINPRTANMLPLHDPIANLVTSMKTENVESVMCDGRWLMRGKVIQTVDEDAVYDEAIARAKAIRERAGIVLPPRFG